MIDVDLEELILHVSTIINEINVNNNILAINNSQLILPIIGFATHGINNLSLDNFTELFASDKNLVESFVRLINLNLNKPYNINIIVAIAFN